MLLISCDYESVGRLYNNSINDTLYFATDKELDLIYENAVKLGFYDNKFNYQLMPKQFEGLFSSHNSEVSENDIPFDTLIITTPSIVYYHYGKEDIFQNFIKKSKFFYVYTLN
jgi:hypothetical protein